MDMHGQVEFLSRQECILGKIVLIWMAAARIKTHVAADAALGWIPARAGVMEKNTESRARREASRGVSGLRQDSPKASYSASLSAPVERAFSVMRAALPVRPRR